MDFPKRKSPRIPEYDYSEANFYFITICTDGKKCIFGEAGNLNWLGRIAEENLIKISAINPSIRLDHYVVMPNHIHAILDVGPDNQKNLSNVIGQYKMSVTKLARKKVAGFRVWQRSYHDHVIRNQVGYEKIWAYIENNPLKWEADCFYRNDGYY
ncbi:MAG: transposase [Oscillospiraceae bacterium]|nr:transposase [Oscillospiraceae bacterium]